MTLVAPEAVKALYVHVPFCARKCEYCAFYSEASDGQLIQRYVQSLDRELHLVAHDFQNRHPATVFFGGGTPSLLNLTQWRQIFQTFHHLGLLGSPEWTIECNPATVSLDKAKLWLDHGVNRISMGVQSLHEPLLERLGRVHSRDMALRSLDTLRQAGFQNINIDLMFGIPGQTLEIWRDTLREALALGTQHLSCYEVIYEEDTPLFAQMKAGEFDVDEELNEAMYETLVEETTHGGMTQYEVANFARNTPGDTGEFPALACKHNVHYWRGSSFHGLGPSASGFTRGQRTRNCANTQRYCDHLERGERAIEFTENLPPLQRAGEIAAFGLRTRAGWTFDAFHQTTGFHLETEWKQELTDLVQRGWAEHTQERFRLTAHGLRFADAAAELMLR